MTANPNVKIGEFSISIVSSFIDPFNPKGNFKANYAFI